jgi:general secretion pathway protein L
VSELRLYARRDSLQDGNGCAWVLLDGAGRVTRSGTSLDDLPPARHCRLILASDMVLLLQADLPDLPARRLAALLPAAAEAATLDDAEQIHVGLLGDGAARRLAVLRKDALARLLTPLRARGLHPDRALPECLLLPWQEDEWSLLLHEDGVVARFGRHDGAALDRGDPPAGLRLMLNRASPPSRIRLYQGSALKAPDVARWTDSIGLPVEPAGAWDWRTATWNGQDNLLTGAYAAARNRLDWRPLVRPLAVALILLGGLQLGGLTLDWALQKREQGAIRAEMRALAERALPANAAVVDPAWQVGEQLRGLRTASGAEGSGALALLARLGQVWPPDGGPVPRTASYAGGELELTLAQADEGWIEQLRRDGDARKLTISVERVDGGQTVVRVRASAAGAGGQP